MSITAGQYITDGTVQWIIVDVRDAHPVGEVFFDDYLHDGAIKANGAAVANASTVIPRLLARAQTKGLIVTAAEYADNVARYVYDDVTDTLTLPDYVGRMVEGGSSVESKEAGLPNLKGNFNVQGTSWMASSNGPFVFSSAATQRSVANGSGNGFWNADFDASKASSIYNDNVTTVQPPAITLIPQFMY